MTKHIWISSDLQLTRADTAREVLKNAVEDVRSLGIPLHEAWCLGDALVGANLEALEQVATASLELYESLGVPMCYVMGNHEADLLRQAGINRFPLYELVHDRPGWHTMKSRDDFYFTREVLGHLVVFLGDHVAEDGSWVTAGGGVHGDNADQYPHQPAAFARLREQIAAADKPVLIASHYAFQGGQRPSPLQDPLLPLPANVRTHFHGHAHIGDLVWNKDNPWQRENPVAGSDQSQFNISALETARSPGSHSAMLTFHGDDRLEIRIRCHLEKEWVEQFVLPPVEGFVTRVS